MLKKVGRKTKVSKECMHAECFWIELLCIDKLFTTVHVSFDSLFTCRLSTPPTVYLKSSSVASQGKFKRVPSELVGRGGRRLPQPVKPISTGGGWRTGCWNDVLRGHFMGIKMQHWNKCLTSLLQDFVSFWSTLSTPSQIDAWKKLKSHLASFHGSRIHGIICVKQIDLGSARTLKKILLKL